MSAIIPFSDLFLGWLFESLLPDFALAFTFFTALTYAVLGRRFAVAALRARDVLHRNVRAFGVLAVGIDLHDGEMADR